METITSLLHKTVLPRVDAKVLLQHLCQRHLGWAKEQLISNDGWPLPESLVANWQQLEQARLQGQPVAYLTHKKSFYQIDLRIDANVLIPRPETELLVDHAIERIHALLQQGASTAQQTVDILDLGTGSGAIILALADYFRNSPHASALRYTASDQSLQALELAKHNAHELGLLKVQFVHSDWLSAFERQAFDLILANPPYIAHDDPHLQQGDLRFEPQMALTDGADGLVHLHTIITQSRRYLRPYAWLLLEHGYQQGTAVKQLLQKHHFASVHTYQDFGGMDRLSLGQNPHELK